MLKPKAYLKPNDVSCSVSNKYLLMPLNMIACRVDIAMDNLLREIVFWPDEVRS